VVEEKRIDEDSRKGRFGWCEFEKNFIPYIFRCGPFCLGGQRGGFFIKIDVGTN
jgi:hypothetical protein